MNGNYTKHIYIGSQRIVSKLGDLDSYGPDPRRIEYAGSNVDGAKVDYKTKYTALQQTIKDRYAQFEVPYYGKDNDDYVNGQGFCCDDTPKTKSFAANDNPELFQYYYHSDHLGSSSLITNLDGETVQHIEYVPFGEVFIEERNNTWNTPYLFNAKELDSETGNYYFGKRYYDPRVSLWLSTDPLQEKYPNISTYAYCFQNPVKYIDPTGMDGEPGDGDDDINTVKAKAIVNTIATTGMLLDFKNNLIPAVLPLKYKRLFSGNNETNHTDTDLKIAEQTNMFVQYKNMAIVDESEAPKFNDYETHVVNQMLQGFVEGLGPEVYMFPVNGVISSKFLGSDVLNAALKDYIAGGSVVGKQYSFGGSELLSDVAKNRTFYSITGFVGSAKITIKPQEKGIHVTIFNITSLTSGDIAKWPNDPSGWVRSIQRPTDRNDNIPKFSNIAQFYFLLIPYSNAIPKR